MTLHDNPGRQRLVELVLLAVILALAAYLRLENLTDNPGWYTDEGTHLEIAQNLAEGRIQYFAINDSLMISARQPLFELMLAGAIKVFGTSMTTLRSLTGVLGVVSVGMVYVFLRYTQKDRILPLLAALITATHPLSVLYTRLGFSYAWLTPLVLLTALALTEYWRTGSRRWLVVAAGAVGVGLISDLMMGSVVPVLVLVVVARRPRDLLWSLPVVAAPFGVYAGVMLLSAPESFLFDLQHTLLRLDRLTLAQQLSTLARNYTIVLSQDFWMPLGLAGLFLLCPVRLRWICLGMLLVPILVMGRTVALFSLSFYYITPLLPFFTLGVAVLIREGVPYIWRTALDVLDQGATVDWQRRIAPYVAGGIAVLIVLTPFATALTMTLKDVRTRFPTVIDPFLIDAENLRQAVDYVNARVDDSDLVVASPGVAWAVEAHTADYQMAVILMGQGTVDLPVDIPAERFNFDPTYTGARFVIVDNLWRNWAAFHMPPVTRMLLDIEQNWPLVFQAGAMEVYQNPDWEG
jgi:4-amino-4-deoxy-L-arabinose transferase-like glycosyltransferase